MAIARPVLSLLAIILLGVGILFNLFIILSGYIQTVSPWGNTYFLQAGTSGITGANNPTRWAYLAICGVDSNGNNACGPTGAAIPFDVAANFGTTTGLPQGLVDMESRLYYLSRTSWSFFIIALFFGGIAFLTSLLAVCSRLGAFLVGSTTFLAVLFQALAAALMTAWTVMGRNAFQAAGQDANLGTYAYAWTWAGLAAYFLAALFFVIGGGVSDKSTSTKRSYFGRKRSTRSRGSFIDNESGRRVKDEYD